MRTTPRCGSAAQHTVSAIRLLICIAFVALIAVGCASAATELAEDTGAPGIEEAPDATSTPTAIPTATSLPEPTLTPEPMLAPEPTLLDQEFVSDIAEQVTPYLIDGFFSFSAIDADGNPVTGSAAAGTVADAPTETDAVPVGSITKVVTSAMVLTLVQDGLVDLDAPAANYVSRLPVPEEVSVRQLLQHRSGIHNYPDEALWEQIMLAPSRVWTPEDVLESIADEPAGTPGLVFSYSNTNYIILGVLVEEVTGQLYHEVVRDRLFEPLGLSAATYLSGFEEGPWPFALDAEVETTSIATITWAAGSLVSSAADMHVFFTALFDGRLLSDELIAQMTEGNRYGLGLEVDYKSDGLFGHSGFIGGYGSSIRHSPELGVTAFQSFALSDPQATLPPGLVMDVVNGFRALDPS